MISYKSLASPYLPVWKQCRKQLRERSSMQASEESKVQAKALAARYGMPYETVLNWMKSKAIEGYAGWKQLYGPQRFTSNAASHEACYQDIVAWVMES